MVLCWDGDNGYIITIMTLQPSRIGRVHGLTMESVKVEMSLCLSSHKLKTPLQSYGVGLAMSVKAETG